MSRYWRILALLIVTGPASAGTEILMEVQQNSVAQSPSSMAIQDGKIRINTSSPGESASQLMIYDSQHDAMTIIDHSNKTFMVIDAKAMDQIQAQIAMVKQQMEQQLASLPAEQREMMKSMLQSRMPMAMTEQPPVVKTMRKTGKTETIAGYECEVTDLLSAGVKTRELCVTAWDEIKNYQAISTVMVSMMRFFDRMLQSLSQNLPISKEMPFAELENLGGFPVKMSAFENGKVKETSQLISILEKNYPADFFSVPKGYSQKDIMPEGMMR